MGPASELLQLAFHEKRGQLVSLSPDGRTASRTHATQEFNHGLVLSSFPLPDNQLFEVRIDKKINSWSGSIEVGVTCCDPNTVDIPFPSSATELREGTWIMSGHSILKDGRSVNEEYGTDLDKLEEGDRVGVLRTCLGDLIFFVNGIAQGVAAGGLPPRVFAVIDMYGKCAQVSLMDNTLQEVRIQTNDQNNAATAAAAACTHLNSITSNNTSHNITNSNIQAATLAASAAVAAATSSGIAIASASGLMRESSAATSGVLLAGGGLSTASGGATCNSSSKIRFHERHGTLIKLGNNSRTAERKRPLDEFNNGVVMTHRPLRDNELFEIRLDRLVDKWSGSIEVGVTTHNPSLLDFPATMTNLRNGTTMMSGSGILTNGKGTRREYGQFNLDELAEGDRIGMMRKANGNLHYFINGLDQGVAASRLPLQVWGVVDLYGMTVKVTIVDRDERDEQNLITRRNLALRTHPAEPLELAGLTPGASDRLLFHTACGSHAAVINSGITAHRPNAADDFNFGVVLTSRPLKANEVFEVRLDKMVTKWAGSIEIGVTTHAPNDLEFPSTMTNIRSGTWMMTGNGVMHNGTTTVDDYGQNLDKLKVGDRVAVVRKETGVLHFYVNSEDQGPAASNVPERVYGVIDLYGQAAQATIIDVSDFRSPGGLDSTVTSATLYSHIESTADLRFHHLHGRNARILNAGLTASRPNALSEFNDAIVMSNRPLHDGEMFEIQIERIVERWSGSIEAGVTLIKPEELEFPNTMTDIDYDTWMLSGSAVMKDGQTVKNGYSCDLDSLSVGSRLGMMRTAEGGLHYYINGEDQGLAIDGVPSDVYAVIDLYGVCGQVSVVHRAAQRIPPPENSLASSQVMESSQVSIPAGESSLRFCTAAGKNVEVTNNQLTATRKRSLEGCLVFSSAVLEPHDTFEVRIDAVDPKWSGSLKIGVTSFSISDSEVNRVPDDLTSLPEVWYLDGSSIFKNNSLVRMNYGPCVDRLLVGDRLAVRRAADGNLRFSVNSEDCGPTGVLVPSHVRAVLQLDGKTSQVTISAQQARFNISPTEESYRTHHLLQDSLENILEEKEAAAATNTSLQFHENRGRNIVLTCSNTVARRNHSYNQGVVLSYRPLRPGEVFEVRLTRLNTRWSSSLCLGVVGAAAGSDRIHLPVSLLHLRRECWVLAGTGLYYNGTRVRTHPGPDLDDLAVGHTVGVMLDGQARLHLLVNGVDQGVAAEHIPDRCWAAFDLYGMAEEVGIVGAESLVETSESKDGRTEKWNEEDETKSAKSNKDIKNSMTTSSQIVTQSLTKSDFLGTAGRLAHCEYLQLCLRLKTSLGIPAFFFDRPELAICYCDTCHKVRGEPSTLTSGVPSSAYWLPLGWCLFPLRARDLVEGSPANPDDLDNPGRDSWHVAYHGTSFGRVRQMLDAGRLLTAGEQGLDRKLGRGPSKQDDSDSPLLYFSPDVECGGGAAPRPFTDPLSRRTYRTRIALMLQVEPGSYKIGGKEGEENEKIWGTKERGNANMTALLFSLQPA